MPLEIPANLHPDCAKVAWLLGTWQGGGNGEYPTIESFRFGQELSFTQDGRPFLTYGARAWVVDGEGGFVRNAAIETGFLRPQPDGSVELLLAHNTGTVEIYLGAVEGARLELSTDAAVRTATAKEYAGGHRLYGLVSSELWFAFHMAAMGLPLQTHLSGRLQRV